MSLNKTKLEILTPEGVFFNNDISIVTLKTFKGYIGLQKGKSNFISSIVTADLRINRKNDKDYKICAISNGVVWANPNKINIITTSIELKEKIDLSRAERAKKRAEEKLNKQLLSNAEIEKAQFALKKAINRINIKTHVFD